MNNDKCDCTGGVVDHAQDTLVGVDIRRRSAGRDGRGHRASTKTLFPVPIRRLMVLLPVFAVKTYLPALVIQQAAAWPASMTDVNAPSRNSAVLAGMRQRDDGGAVGIDGEAERRERAGGRGHGDGARRR